jgi:hypothetical protein
MSNSKIEVGYVFKFDCNNTVPRLKGTLETGETVSAKVSREIKPHPESMTTWYDLEIPTVVHEAFAVRLTAPEIRDMGGKLDIPATASEFSSEIIAASDKGDHKKVCSIWGSISQIDDVAISNGILIEMHKLPGIKDAIVEAGESTRPNFEYWARKATERKLHSLGIIENFDEVTAVSFWVNTHTGQRMKFDEARNIIDELGVSIFE